ncbi:MarR family winged helix-turn-helix transcriptional regulator [Rhodoferax sp. TS-BS-61-7]|uniref:MarR family winged helix-turn-helix transcriptional regulator n=1 Tax=Rhodoferax sp. TS-BS-61-7 TaxID=2094194 RepID=UPI000CF6CF0F|nr:MarR family transcriptional regulator [Rhodoferax sp. TS-BS-61-7]PQA75940.1 MarR family transcriptional regulator [Rhodoferax sp. TS-BS-61-7]
MRRTKADKFTDLVLTVFRVHGVLIDWGDDFAAQEELSSARWQMLGALALADHPLTTPQIAARMGVTRQGAQKQLNLLAESGLVETRPNPVHKRSPLYVLTAAGRAKFGAIDTRWKKYASRTAALFSASDLDRASEVLNILAEVTAAAKTGGTDE